MSSKAYQGVWENGLRYSHGDARFAGQTRDRLQDNGWKVVKTFTKFPNCERCNAGHHAIAIQKTKYDEGIIIRTTYGVLPIDNSVNYTGGMVATISERIKPSLVVPKKENYIGKMLNQAFYEMGWEEEADV